MITESRYLKFAQINEIVDAQALEDLIETLEREASGIEAQLDFPTDDQDDEWERRAVAALGHKRAQIGCARRRHHRLTRGTDGTSKQDDEALIRAIQAEAKAKDRLSKAENRKLDAAERQMAQTERLARETAHRAATAADTELAIKRRLAKSLQALHTDSLWRTVAYDILTKDQITEINTAMIERQRDKLIAFFGEENAA